jgi:hypothetical protein
LVNIISLVISSVYDGMDAVKHRLPDGRGSEKGTPLPNRDRKGAGAFLVSSNIFITWHQRTFQALPLWTRLRKQS